MVKFSAPGCDMVRSGVRHFRSIQEFNVDGEGSYEDFVTIIIIDVMRSVSLGSGDNGSF